MYSVAGQGIPLDPMGNPDDNGMPGIVGVFFAIFIVAVIASIVIAVVKFSRTRQMAMDKGASDAEATALALSGDVGTAAAFIKPVPHLAPRTSADRIAEINSLQEHGLITPDQARTRIDEILRGI